MPVILPPGDGDAISLDELVDRLEATTIDARDEAGFATLGPWLARLGRNRRFLGDLAIAELKTRCADQLATNGYGGQVLMLRPPNGRYVLRANFWPAAGDAMVRASGAEAFAYGMAHDHNFPFLTYGYLGPGYVSEDWERDPAALIGLPGEPAGLTPRGTTQLAPGTLALYRARIDVHRQAPPPAFSVSLNILAADVAQPWIEQYRFDVARGTVAAGLSIAPAEALLALAVAFGCGNGRDLAHRSAERHPCARMRVTAIAALTEAAGADGLALLERAAADPDRYVAGHARRVLSEMEDVGR
jgi:hypothetical protein